MGYSTVDIVLNVVVLSICVGALLNGLRTKEQFVSLTTMQMTTILVAIAIVSYFEPILAFNLVLLVIIVTHKPRDRERFTIERIHPKAYMQYMTDLLVEEEEPSKPLKKRVRFAEEPLQEPFTPQPPPPQQPPQQPPQPPPQQPPQPPPQQPPQRPPQQPPQPPPQQPAEACYSGFHITEDMLERAQTNLVG